MWYPFTYRDEKMMVCGEMKISCQALSHKGFPETLLATPAVERVFSPNGVMAQHVFIMQQCF